MVLQRCLFLKSVSSSMCLLDVIFGRLKRSLGFDSFFFSFSFSSSSTYHFFALLFYFYSFTYNFRIKTVRFVFRHCYVLHRGWTVLFCIVIWHNLHAVMNGNLAWTGRRETVHSKKYMFFFVDKSQTGAFILPICVRKSHIFFWLKMIYSSRTFDYFSHWDFSNAVHDMIHSFTHHVILTEIWKTKSSTFTQTSRISIKIFCKNLLFPLTRNCHKFLH